MSDFPPQLPLLDNAKEAIRKHTDRKPAFALVLGSGLGDFANTLENKTVIPYTEIPGIPSSGVIGHAGNLVFGDIGSLSCVAMQGRVHLYEGHTPQEIVFGARLMFHLGAHSMIVTNAAGGLGEGMTPGDLMVIDDHLNMTGRNCLEGPNEDALGTRFPDMSTAYDAEYRQLAHDVAKDLGLSLQRGVYAGLLGPTYETPAEIRMLSTIGATAVGMSTVLEVIAARHMKRRVLGISCITNMAAGISATELDHAEVKETATQAKPRFQGLLRGVLERLASA